MGGDHAPQIVVNGAALAAERFPDTFFYIYGDEALLNPLIKKQRRLDGRIEVCHTPDRVKSEDKPRDVIRSGKQTSMWLAIDRVKQGEADAVVSAGNTGALMAISKLVLGGMKGIKRPAIATFLPNQLGGESVMLDLGANTECDGENLVQFAVLGEVFARAVLGIERPSVGLLNIGSEDQKGRSELKDAAAILRTIDLPIDFHGYVEGTDIPKGTVDVVVTDGFSGNIALKTIEGTAKLTYGYFKEAFRSSMMARIGYLFARQAIAKLRARVDPRRYNGAVLLGLNGISVKSHGGTDAFGFASAIGVAHDLAKNKFVESVSEEVKNLPDLKEAIKAATDNDKAA